MDHSPWTQAASRQKQLCGSSATGAFCSHLCLENSYIQCVELHCHEYDIELGAQQLVRLFSANWGYRQTAMPRFLPVLVDLISGQVLQTQLSPRSLDLLLHFTNTSLLVQFRYAQSDGMSSNTGKLASFFILIFNVNAPPL